METVTYKPQSKLNIIQDYKDLYELRHIWKCMVKAALKVQYQRSSLGFLWSLLTPLLYMSVMAIAFSNILGRDIPAYPIFLFCGLVPYMTFMQVMQRTGMSIITREQFLRKSNRIKLLYPIVNASVESVHSCCSLASILLILIVYRTTASPPMLLVPISFILLVLFSFGSGLIFMTLVTYFRDWEHLIQVVFRSLYFITPIIVKPEMLGDYEWIMNLNPLTHFVRLFRDPIYNGICPPLFIWGLCISLAFGTIILGYLLYKKFEHDYIYQL